MISQLLEKNKLVQLYFVLSFTTAIILGNYARLGISALADYEFGYISSGSILWSNLTSCLLMGILQVLKIENMFEAAGLKELFVVLTTGFCGSFSSYSSMMMEVFLHSTSLGLYNIEHSTKLPNRAYGIMEFLSVILTQLFVSMGSYLFGREFASSIIVPLGSDVVPVGFKSTTKDKAEALESSDLTKNKPKPLVVKTLQALHLVFIVLAIPLVALIIVLTCVYNNYSRGSWTLPQIFGLFGSWLRYLLANWFNSANKNFPYGTFLANEFAALMIAVLQVIYRGRRGYGEALPIANTANKCRITTALISGFCGSLSTISTFIHEGYKLNFRAMSFYYTVSIAVSYCIIVIILGSFAWTRGLIRPLC